MASATSSVDRAPIMWTPSRISFLVLNAARATLVGQQVLPEIAPITGPMYQLFVFFMITDPRTIVRGRNKQITVAILIAVTETVIRFAADNGWPLPIGVTAAPAFYALATVGPIAKWLDLRRSRKPVGSTTQRRSMSFSRSIAAS